MKKCHFNKITVIQSLGEKDLHTGTKICEDIDLHNAIHARGLEIELLDVISKDDFVGIFKKLTKEAVVNKTIPVVHIESHGSDDSEGLVLSSGEFLNWDELKPLAIGLNTATRLNLLIVLAACHGANFTKKLAPSERSPCWALAGPVEVVGQKSILRSFSSFYQEILKSGDGGAAVRKLNEHSGAGDIKYYFTTAETFFTYAYKRYIKTGCSKQSYGARAQEMRRKLIVQKVYPLPSVADLQLELEKSQEAFFEKYRALFFMYDLFPENTERFTVNYEDIKYG